MDRKISILVFTCCFRFACCPFVAFDDCCHSFFRFLILFCLLTACTKEFPLEFIQCFPETGNCIFQVIDGFLQFCDGFVFSSNRSESIWIIRSFCFISLLKSMSCPFESTVNPSLFFRYLYCTKRKAWLQMPSKIRLALCRKPDSSFFLKISQFPGFSVKLCTS